MFSIKHGLGAGAFEFLLPPALLVKVAGVHEFGTNRARIGFAQDVEQLAQRHALFAKEGVAGVEYRFQIGIIKAVKRQFKFGNIGALGAFEWIKVSPACARVAVGGNQLLCGSTFATEFNISTGRIKCHAGCASFGTFCKSINHGLVWNVFIIAAVKCRQMLQIVEIFAPVFGHAARVGQIVFVHFFNVRGIAAK